MYTKTHRIVPPFKKFLEETCPLNIQYTKPASTLTISLCLYKK